MAPRSTNNDDLLAAAMASGKTIAQAAAEAHVSERTAKRRSTDPAFRAKVSALRGEVVSAALGRLADGMSDAASKLRDLLNAEAETVRLGAARSLIELGLKVREAVELEERVRVLEERATTPPATDTEVG